MQFHEINTFRVMIINLQSFYKKHDFDKNWIPKQERIASIIERAQIILLP